MSLSEKDLRIIRDGYDMRPYLKRMPVLPLRGLVAFPNSKIQLELGRNFCITAVEKAMESGRRVYVAAQTDPLVARPKPDQIFAVGTVAQIHQIIRGEDNSIKIIIEGLQRSEISDVQYETEGYLSGMVIGYIPRKTDSTNEQIAKARLLKKVFRDYVELSPKLPKDVAARVELENNITVLTDFIASNTIVDFGAKQALLEEFDLEERLDMLISMLRNDNEIMEIQRRIIEKTNDRMDENQREYFLHEQIRAIREELGEEDVETEAELFKDKIMDLRAPEEVKEVLLKECSRLKKLPEASPEAFTLHTYLETCLALPWSKFSKDRIDISAVERVLDKNHYGLAKVKERIVEYLAVRKLAPDVKGQIICLVGPPGVGKTSIAQSIGTAINRKVERIALGGVRDEAEIRGHRRTYIAAMPGRIISAMKSAGTTNPIIILDEIDKLASDSKGDPTSALLEVLDPEQNNTFRDHYIDIPFDLSNVMFITTANDASMIPGPLKDRMELIELGSYTREEKFQIAKKHLIPKQLKNCGLKAARCKFSSSAIYSVIDGYTGEAGVRNLERTLASVMRKVAKNIAAGDEETVFKIDSKNIESYLGPVKYKNDEIPDKHSVGYVNGLAWTSVGGVTLPIETAVIPGTGKIIVTGSLGDVMQESAKIAVTCVRSRAEKLGIESDFYKKYDLHIHALEGAVPKDGPSAGITMTTAIVSALTERPVNRYVAMTGEISLRGRVLPIGGLREKAMGAYKAGVKTIVIPKRNESDICEIDETVREKLNIIPVETIDEVLDIAFTLDSTYEKTPVKKKPRKRAAASPNGKSADQPTANAEA